MSLPILTIDTLPADCSEVIGLVHASCCISKSIVGDFFANVRNWTIGGHLNAYADLIDEALYEVEEKLRQKAQARGARAIICFRLSSSQVTAGAVELIAYGTAVR
jgi:uncharacterized protein YbjQ (UPF0145 family)